MDYNQFKQLQTQAADELHTQHRNKGENSNTDKFSI